ncbi:MAG: hypothetical protein GXZ15_05595 [Campylobacter sp.]|nr:hypothetical protein [Campylobacter sp.]
MQRSSSDLQILKTFVLVIFLLGYQLLSSIFNTIPPLIGFCFTYVIVLHYEKDASYKDYSLWWYMTVFYLFIAEQIHGFELFSVAIAFGIFYYFLLDIVLANVKFRDICLMIITACGYIGTFFVSNFLTYLKDGVYLTFGFEYVMYIFIEALFALLVFKGRIL